MKNNNVQRIFTIAILALLTLCQVYAKGKDKKENPEGYTFTSVVDIQTTPVKNQSRSGTCWSFATTSFLETELIRMGKGEYDLSEMFFVRNAYEEKAKDNLLREGKGNMNQGGQAHDVLRVLKNHGALPESIYNGLNYGLDKHNHKELNALLKGLNKAAIEAQTHTPYYEKAYKAVLNVYFGELPGEFNYNGKNYHAKSFAADLGINPDDYIELTSYNHHPYYEKFVLEIPDNWTCDRYYNLPIDELMEVMNHALNNGFSVAWDGDVSEKGFSHKNGVAIVPDLEKADDLSGTDRARFENLSEKEKADFIFEKPFPEINITQEIRQETFEDFSTTDDHLMHLTGIVKDQNGTVYYKTKNSWGTERNTFGGYLNMSESYVRLKTVAIMVHKDAIPEGILKKLGL